MAATALLGVCALPLGAVENGGWSDTLERISTGVVSIRVDGTRAFDTEWNQSTQATGFVVDAERGLILTNRHVVMPGPVVAEEVDLRPVYRDPVHDFGFYRYDPADLRFIQPTELPLVPEHAEIGREIRVVGNDAGEQLSILAGTIARLDRRAPDYGRGKYNDFNTFYLQAASSTSGGSSGSPVIDIEGNVVALNAGGSTNAATSFYLPLDRIERALRLLQRGETITRGTLQTVFLYRPYEELNRLGLRVETEASVRTRFPGRTGMLVVAQVLPGFSAEGMLEPGDILVRVNGELMADFVSLAKVLDANVGGNVAVEVERGGQQHVFDVQVGDLHAITPDEYIHFGDAVVHNLSYQQARHFNMPMRGTYVANPGYVFSIAGIPRGSVVTEINGTPVPDLDALEAVLAALANRERVAVRFFTFDDPQTSQVRVTYMDRRWFPASRCQRDDTLGVWPCRDLADVSSPKPLAPGSTRFAVNGDARVRKITPSLVMVNFDMPYTVSGVSERHYHGTGLVVDAERGLVVADRNTVPVALGDVRITLAGSLEVPGRVEYVHPLHNLAVVSYDPALVGDTRVRSAEFNLRPVEPGDAVWVVGLKGDHKLVSQATEVASVDSAIFPLSRTLRFRDTNLETIELVNAPDEVDGVLVDRRGRVVSMWSSFAFQAGRELNQVNKGVPAELVVELLDVVRDHRPLRSLDVEFAQVPLSAARKLGLPESWVSRLEAHNPERRQALEVIRVVAGSPAAEALRSGDLLLAIDGETVNSFREVERAVQKDTVGVSVWRNAEQLDFDLATVVLDGLGLDRVVMWAGALLQAPHRAMAAQRGILPEGVYVAYFGYGSPATRYGLWAGRRIVEVDSQPTPDLDAFMALVAGKQDRDSVRLKTITWNNQTEVITLKLDLNYWPAYELRRTDQGWERIALN